MKKNLSLWTIVLLLAVMVFSSCVPAPSAGPAEVPDATEASVIAEVQTPEEQVAVGNDLILATTTSTEDSGLLDVLLPKFEEETGIQVNVIAVGTGQALTLGQDGNADVLLVHARAKEDEFMAAGHGVRREDVMYNDFIIAGPESDPAGIQGETSAIEAFKKIATAEAPFISRGDESGTHTKELGIWKKAGVDQAGDWYLSTGQGMGEVLAMASEQQAYTLSDRATYLARAKAGLDLVVLVEGDKDLFNPYGVIAVNPDKGPQIEADLANQFIDWIISLPVQEKIAEFGVEAFGQALFIPDSQAWRAAKGAGQQPAAEEKPSDGQNVVQPPAPADTAMQAAALRITGLVEQAMGWNEDELKAMEPTQVESTNSQGEKQTYIGIPINSLLELASIKPEATRIVLLADDGFTAEMTLADLQKCPNCILSFRSKGSLSSVMPDYPDSMQVQGVIEIQVK